MTPVIAWLKTHIQRLPWWAFFPLLPAFTAAIIILGVFTREAWTPWPVRFDINGETITVPWDHVLPFDDMESAIRHMRMMAVLREYEAARR